MPLGFSIDDKYSDKFSFGTFFHNNAQNNNTPQTSLDDSLRKNSAWVDAAAASSSGCGGNF